MHFLYIDEQALSVVTQQHDNAVAQLQKNIIGNIDKKFTVFTFVS